MWLTRCDDSRRVESLHGRFLIWTNGCDRRQALQLDDVSKLRGGERERKGFGKSQSRELL